MRSGRRFVFGHDPAPPRAVQPPARQVDEITAPLPDLAAPVSPAWQGRPTLPLAASAVPVRPALPFRAPAQVREVAPREVAPVPAPTRRRGFYLAMALASLALYNTVLVAVVARPGATNAPPAAAQVVSASPPAVAPPPSAAPPSEASASPPAPTASASVPAPLASPPRNTPVRVGRSPAPARTPRPSMTDVRDPWGF